jgi:hypothetical protein
MGGAGVREIPLAEFGLVTVAEACAARGWAAKTVQNWINAGLLPAVVIGAGRSARFLLRRADVDGFAPPKKGPKPGNRNARKKPPANGGRRPKG